MNTEFSTKLEAAQKSGTVRAFLVETVRAAIVAKCASRGQPTDKEFTIRDVRLWQGNGKTRIYYKGDFKSQLALDVDTGKLN